MVAALLVIDVQEGFHDPVWGPTTNPECEDNVRRLLDAWRTADWPVVLVRHDSQMPGSPLSPDHPGNEFAPGVEGPHDLLVTKSVNSAFYGDPDLDSWLRDRGLLQVVICGITTNHCCETTARMAGNLGYDVRFVLDATRTFDRVGPDGVVVPAATLMSVTAANLHGEFARVLNTDEALELLSN